MIWATWHLSQQCEINMISFPKNINVQKTLYEIKIRCMNTKWKNDLATAL